MPYSGGISFYTVSLITVGYMSAVDLLSMLALL